MTYEGNNIWSFDFGAKGIELSPGKQYGIIFTADWNVQTCDIIFDTSIMGDTAYCTANMVENNVDSNKRSYDVRWKNADPGKYAPPVCITAIGNIIGNAYWADTTPYDMLVNFIKSDGKDGLANALKFNGKSVQKTLDDVAAALGLSAEDIERAIEESGKNIDWNSEGVEKTSQNGFSFTKLDDGTYMITDCSKQVSKIKIPATIRVLADDDDDSVGGYDYEEPATLPQISTNPPQPKYKDAVVSAIGDWAFANNKYVETVEIPDSIKNIGKGAFYNCVKLQSITVPEGVTALSANTFEKCLYLEEVKLGSKLKSIGDEAFYDCRRLRTLDIPASVKNIGEEAFTNCRSLTSLTIPDGVKKLGDENSVGYGMFENCKNLSEIKIPASVGYINPDTFMGCGSLTIFGEMDSAAREYAVVNRIPFRMISDPDCKVGDINGNGTVTIDDATMVQKAVAEIVTLTGAQTFAADANGDGEVNINDVTQIQKYIAELVDHLG